MTPLRQRMMEDLQLRGLSAKRQDSYVRAVRQLAEPYHKSPDLITEEELRLYFLYLENDKHASRSAFTIALSGLKFFYPHTLQREWATLDLARPVREKKLPVVLSAAEVQLILGCLRRPPYRVCLTTIYSCGLRRREGVYLQVSDHAPVLRAFQAQLDIDRVGRAGSLAGVGHDMERASPLDGTY
jgi:integrase/recombinase XerD